MQEQLTMFLKAQWPDAEVMIEEFAIIAGGYSEETFRFDCRVRRGGSEDVLPMILRKDPDPAVDILRTSREREHYLLRSLRANTGIPVSDSHFVISDPSLLGQQAMLLQRVHGSGMVSELFNGGPASHLAETVATELCEYIAELHLADIQKVDPEGQLRDPRNAGIDVTSWDTYMDTTYEWYVRGFEEGRFCPMPNALDTYLMMRRNRPRPLKLTLVHGDFNPSNFLYDPDGHVTAIIDWENARIGDPREDLGWMKHMDVLSNTDIMGSVKKDGGFLNHYNRITGFGVTEEEVEYFRLFGSSNIAMSVFPSMVRRMNKEHTELLTLYIIQPVIVSMLGWAQLSGYPMAPGGE